MLFAGRTIGCPPFPWALRDSWQDPPAIKHFPRRKTILDLCRRGRSCTSMVCVPRCLHAACRGCRIRAVANSPSSAVKWRSDFSSPAFRGYPKQGNPARILMSTAETSVVEFAQQRVELFTDRVRSIRQRLHEVVVGQDDTIDLLLTCGLTGSHALLVGVPGLAKTLMVKALAAAFDWKFTRIQFTPDLMPSDITGYELFGRDAQAGAPSMVFRPGPIFANLVLADEINRGAENAIGLAGSDGRTACDRRRVAPIRWRNRSWSWPRKTRSSRKGPIRCRKRSWIGS